MKKLFVVVSLLMVLLLSGCASSGCFFSSSFSYPDIKDGGEKLTVGDVRSYGNNFIGKTVYSFGYIQSSMPAQLESNKGMINLFVVDYYYPCNHNPNSVDYYALEEGMYDWKIIKQWVDTRTLLVFKGKVISVEKNIEGNALTNKQPAFLITSISEYR